ncbi:hypothetical protein ENTCAN_08507 [Enterobacter cancerogenus ATCC 35316]|nr:hypothetical protein ENTCAN_08507 [Enterobacter cancerogenus ATCC 35316]
MVNFREQGRNKIQSIQYSAFTVNALVASAILSVFYAFIQGLMRLSRIA